MSANDQFFEERQAAAVLKHGILKRYVPVFASKTGRVPGANNRSAVVDGNAGRGRYADGSDGSPLLLAAVSEFVAKLAKKDVRLTFVEQDPGFARELCELLTTQGLTPPPVIEGDLEDHIDEVLDRSAGRPLLTFLDPFGSSIPMATVTDRLMERGRSMPSEVLLHFSLISVRRKGPAALNMVEPWLKDQLDQFLGGDWWMEVMADRDRQERGSATRQAIVVSDRYRQAVEERCRCRSIAIDVKPAPDLLPIYRMILFTRSHHGLWYYANAAGGGYVDWATHCSDADFRRQQLERDELGLMSLWGDEAPPDRSDLEARLTARVEPEIHRNLVDLLNERGQVHLGWHTEAVYGSTLGQASRVLKFAG